MTDLFPVHKVFTVIDRHSGKKLETAGHQIIIVSYAADARVRIHTGNNGIRVSLSYGCHGDDQACQGR
jgi:hypothetical protein